MQNFRRNLLFNNNKIEYDPTIAVDLGLPSGLIWAKGNIVPDGNGGYMIGEETDYGAYVSWGNIVPHFTSNGSTFDDGYNWGSSMDGPYASTPGAGINLSSWQSFSEDSGYDAARELLGGKWKMPTGDDFNELVANCKFTWLNNYKNSNVKGCLLTSKKNGATLFFPAIGWGVNTTLSDFQYRCRYWTTTYRSPSKAAALNCREGLILGAIDHEKYYGCPVRAVLN